MRQVDHSRKDQSTTVHRPYFMMLKCQKGMKANPSSEVQQYRLDNGVSRNLSEPGDPWQNGKAEKCHSDIWLSQCSAKAGAHTVSQGQERYISPLMSTHQQYLGWQACDGGFEM